MPSDAMTAPQLREWAGNCERSANDPRISGDERAKLLKMKLALLELAELQQWLDGEARRADNENTSRVSRTAMNRR